MKALVKAYYQLTKLGIVVFVLLTAISGYFLSLDHPSGYSSIHFFLFVIGLYFLTSGSFILNQAQEWKLDKKMKRTANRPIPSKQISPAQGYILSIGFIFIGLGLLFLLNPLTALLGFLTLIFYNFFYTFLKKLSPYAAVLGAVPGAMPPIIGYSLGRESVWTTECMYLFLILFLWQMPHFWTLAIRYKEDYRSGGIPVLPVSSGSEYAFFEMTLYFIAYAGLMLISPLFLKVGFLYLFLCLPILIKVFYEFFKYFHNQDHWLRFFIWINVSILIFVSAPIFDKWLFYYLLIN